MNGNVLVAIDGSAASDIAVDLAAGLAWPEGTTIRVVQAIDLGPGLFGGPWPSLALAQAGELEDAIRIQARADVERARELLEAPSRSVTTTLEDGRAATVILDEAGAMPADLVVIGSRGHGAIATMVLGSTSAEVIDHASVPVLVARGPRVDRAVLAWDGSPTASAALDAVRKWAILADTDVRVVTVAAHEADAVEAQRFADEAVARLREAGRTAATEVREGDAATEIIQAAQAVSADLIVIGTHGRTGLARLTLGSVASNVTRHAPCSVLVVRNPGATEAVLQG